MPSLSHGLSFEEFVVGTEYGTERRTITDTDIEAFADVSGDRNPLHLDQAYAAATGFGGRIAHGVLGLAVATGLLNQLGLTRGTLLALAGLNWSFRLPVRPGDEVHALVRVLQARPTRKRDRGLVVLGIWLRNAVDQVVQEGELTLLIRRTRLESRES
jgi:acyl dehydratase